MREEGGREGGREDWRGGEGREEEEEGAEGGKVRPLPHPCSLPGLHTQNEARGWFALSICGTELHHHIKKSMRKH